MSKHCAAVVLLVMAACVLASCRGAGSAFPAEGEGDTLRLKYSSLLTIVRHEGYTDVTVKNPWKQGAVLHRYRLLSSAAGSQTAEEGVTVVHTPVDRAAVFTTVHCSLLTQFGVGENIVGIADLKYIKIPYIHERVTSGHIADCGNGLAPVVEKIIDGQMADGFFRDCPITFADIQAAKTVLKEKLKSIYHTRVSYPTLKSEPASLKAVPATEEAAPAPDAKREESYKGSTSK